LSNIPKTSFVAELILTPM